MPGKRICLRLCARQLRLAVAATIARYAACLRLRTQRLSTRAVIAICGALICCHTAPHLLAPMVAADNQKE